MLLAMRRSSYSSVSSRPAILRQRLSVRPESDAVPALGSPVAPEAALLSPDAPCLANSQGSASLSFSTSPP